jgi:HK97 family phage portal protein
VKLFGLEIGWSRKASDAMSLDTVLRRLEGLHETASGISVTPENCMQAPTVQAIVTAISRRIATLPIRVQRKVTSNGRTRREELPNHPVAKLLNRPNDWQSRVEYWLDATSSLVRYGNYFAQIARGQTGPIRRLLPLHAGGVRAEQDESWAVTYKVTQKGAHRDLDPSRVHHVRGPARDGLNGDSPIRDIAEAIAVEIAAERMGASIFGNAAMPSLVFQYSAGNQGHKTDEDRSKFLEDYGNAYGRKGRFKALLLPKGIELGDQLTVDYEKAQFLATRAYQRTVIAGAFGVPPHIVGDLTKMTFGNVEQQTLDFVMGAVLPYVRVFEAAMERDLLTDEDRAGGVVIRFNLDGALRADFKTRQEGLNIQRNAGVISPNDWRETEGMNPISDEDGGDDYWRKGPSGQTADAPAPAGALPAPAGDATDSKPSI